MIKPSVRIALGVTAILALGAPISVWASNTGGNGANVMPSIATPAYSPAEEYRKGLEALKVGKYHDAEHYLQHVLETNPDSSPTLFMLGLAKTGLGDLKGAERAYALSIKADPKFIPARREHAVTLAKLGQAAKAQAELNDLKARLDACASTCAEAADLTAAVAAVQTAMAPPTSPAPGAPATPDATKAPASLLLHSSPADGDNAYAEAVRMINEKRYDAALASLRHASDVFGPHPDVLTYIGYTYRKLHDYGQAETYYKQALKIAPNHRGATEYYGELMVERGDIAGAKHMLARLDDICSYGCVEREDLARWIANGPPAS